MPSPSQYLGLQVPNDSDSFVTEDLAANWRKIDQAPGRFVCTSTTRPTWSDSQAGREIYEKDTDHYYTWTGASTGWKGYPGGRYEGYAGASAVQPFTLAGTSTWTLGLNRTLFAGRRYKYSVYVASSSSITAGNTWTVALTLPAGCIVTGSNLWTVIPWGPGFMLSWEFECRTNAPSPNYVLHFARTVGSTNATINIDAVYVDDLGDLSNDE